MNDVWHAVQPLDAAVEAAVLAVLRKLSHDVSNSLVAAVSHFDLLGLRDPSLRDAPDWLVCRQQLSRPREVVGTALRALPLAARDQPRTLTDLAAWWQQRCAALGFEAPIPPLTGSWTAPEVVFALYAVLANAAESLEESRRLGEPLRRPPRIEVTAAGGAVRIDDSGPGCADVVAAATGRARRAGGGHTGLGLAAAAAALQRVGGSLHIASRHWGNNPASVEPNHGFAARLVVP